MTTLSRFYKLSLFLLTWLSHATLITAGSHGTFFRRASSPAYSRLTATTTPTTTNYGSLNRRHSRRRRRFNLSFLSPKNRNNNLEYSKEEVEEEENDQACDSESDTVGSSLGLPRGGQSLPGEGEGGIDTFVQGVTTVTNILVQAGSLVLPPLFAVTKTIVAFYRALPKDAIVAQVGLVYCFAGGYYPTLFSSLQAAQQYGWNVMVEAIEDLAEEAIRAIEALEQDEAMSASKFGGTPINGADMAQSFRKKTGIVMAAVDPMKINQAAGALYMTWVGVKSVLEQEYARVITLSLTMARYIERVARFVLAPPAYFMVPDKYHQWVPVVIGWGCKAAAMNIAWRIQRIMTAATSAVTGGLLFARAVARMLSKRGIRLFGLIREDHESTFLDEIIGFLVAGLGFYTQFESQWRSGFSFRVPFPLSLITWPFDFLESWIQWQITK